MIEIEIYLQDELVGSVYSQVIPRIGEKMDISCYYGVVANIVYCFKVEPHYVEVLKKVLITLER